MLHVVHRRCIIMEYGMLPMIEGFFRFVTSPDVMVRAAMCLGLCMMSPGGIMMLGGDGMKRCSIEAYCCRHGGRWWIVG